MDFGNGNGFCSMDPVTQAIVQDMVRQRQRQSDAMQKLGPEGIQLLNEAEFAPEEQKLLDEQMARAQALREKQFAPVQSEGGSILNGLAGGLNSFLGGYQQREAMDKQKALVDLLKKASGKYKSSYFNTQGDGLGFGDFTPPTRGGMYG